MLSELLVFTKVAILRQNQRMKELGWVIMIVIVLFSCKKEEEGSCFDGVISAGELTADCGGVCPPCAIDNSPTDFFIVAVNGVQMQFSERTLVSSPSWIMNFSNDTLDVTLNFGNGAEPGSYAIEQPFTQATMNEKDFNFLHEGLVVLAEIDSFNNRLTGFFEAKLVWYSTDSLLVDTLRISNGNFESIPY